MSAIRKFDEEATLQAVMDVFWRQGYERTSIDDLEAATGVKRGSLYNAFGGKEALFLLAFDRCSRTIEDRLLQVLEGGNIEQAMARLFDAQLDFLDDPKTPPGCFVANALNELGHLDGALGRAVRDRMERTETVLYDRLMAAQAAGQIVPGTDIRALARYALAMVRTLPVMHRGTSDSRMARDVARVALTAFRQARSNPA